MIDTLERMTDPYRRPSINKNDEILPLPDHARRQLKVGRDTNVELNAHTNESQSVTGNSELHVVGETAEEREDEKSQTTELVVQNYTDEGVEKDKIIVTFESPKAASSTANGGP